MNSGKKLLSKYCRALLICPKNYKKAKLRFMYAVQQQLKNISDGCLLVIKHRKTRGSTFKQNTSVMHHWFPIGTKAV
jgi:hypothetical protein